MKIHQSIIKITKNPLLSLLLVYFIYITLSITLHLLPDIISQSNKLFLIELAKYLLKLFQIAIFFWFLLNALKIGHETLQHWLMTNNKKTSSVMLKIVSNSLRASIILLMINIIIPALDLTGFAEVVAEKSTNILLIIILTWLAFDIVNGIAALILEKYHANNYDLTAARKLNTQIVLLKRIILSLIMVIAVAAILMSFQRVKNLGAGLLTTAGLLSAVGAFASQQSLSRIFAGLQIAFAQHIRIGDTVVIDNEFGQIEEITLSTVVIKLWDLRRLILPTNYFISKGFQNLTHYSTELLGTVFLYMDYTLPVDAVRKKFHELIAQSKLWDKKVSNFQVTNITQNCMEIRMLVSAADANKLWDLRCEIRENIIKFIIDSYPECLPKARNLAFSANNISKID